MHNITSNQSLNPLWVVKIGGSLLGAQTLAKWLATIVTHSHGHVIIVPGGGIFADAVREAQQRSGISDSNAHHLALLAMDQYGLLLTAMNDELVTASSELEIAERAWQHRGIVWLPSKMVLADETIAQNWAVTSDSLSAWLANQLSASQLILVKSKSIEQYRSLGQAYISQLVQKGFVDAKMESFMTKASYQTWILHQTDYSVFNQGLVETALEKVGLRVLNN
jgi:5-(aminomethyl)-3-furanmethanol phosphate kinase